MSAGAQRRVGRRLLTILTLAWATASASSFAAPERPAWLHLDPTPSTASAVPASALRLDEARAAEYVEQGYDTAGLLVRNEWSWEADGTLVKRGTIVRRYLTDEGVRAYGNLSAGVRSQLQDLYVEEAWIALPDGGRRDVNMDAVQLITDASTEVFSDDVTVVLPLEGLVPGATAVFVTRVVERTGDWPLPSSELVLPQSWTPLQRFELEARWDDSLPPRKLFTDAAFLDCRRDRRSWSCHAQDIEPLPSGTDHVVWLDVLPEVVVSEPHDWADLVDATRALVARSVASGASLRDPVLRLIEGAETPRERLARIHRFVADEIRYVGMEHGTAAVEPAPVDRTFELRYGDCKGKVALFLAMAEHAGIRGYPVLTSTGRNSLDKLRLPGWRYFDHMIACAEIDDEDAPVCLDLTSPDADTGTLPPSLYGSVALDIRGGVTGPRTIEPPGYVWDIDIVAENELHCDGNLTENLRRTFHGAGSVGQRPYLRSLTTAELERWGVEDYRIVYGEEAEPEVGFEGVEDPTGPLVLRSKTRFEHVLAAGGNVYREPDSWLIHYAQWFSTVNERYPWWIPSVRIRSRMNYRMCPGSRVRFVGAALEFDSEFGSLRRQYRHESNRVEVETRLELPMQTIGSENLDRYRRFLDAVLAQTTAWFRFEGEAVTGEVP